MAAAPEIVNYARTTGKLIRNLISDEPEIRCNIPLTGEAFIY